MDAKKKRRTRSGIAVFRDAIIIHPPLQPVFVLGYSRLKVFMLLQAVLGDNWQSTVISS